MPDCKFCFRIAGIADQKTAISGKFCQARQHGVGQFTVKPIHDAGSFFFYDFIEPVKNAVSGMQSSHGLHLDSFSKYKCVALCNFMKQHMGRNLIQTHRPVRRRKNTAQQFFQTFVFGPFSINMKLHLRIKQHRTGVKPQKMIHMGMAQQKIQPFSSRSHLPFHAPVKLSQTGSCIQNDRLFFCMNCYA